MIMIERAGRPLILGDVPFELFSDPDYIAQFTPEELQSARAQAEKIQRKAEIRQTITLSAGDTQSLLGTTADAVHILLYEIATFGVTLSQVQTLAEVRAAAKGFNATLGDFAQRVVRGEVKLPYQNKGSENPLTEIEMRATAVTQAFTQRNQD
ncbi:hypothetical protein [Candidatus Regiella endosymbiont of Tuberolachnus salignus]|uniref:hypothetical protein n=1 Tax=Candidatus Regiella endosymbiont of Tuberolachnus salignus TaxID=3077956 RepID=UPI0030CC1383